MYLERNGLLHWLFAPCYSYPWDERVHAVVHCWCDRLSRIYSDRWNHRVNRLNHYVVWWFLTVSRLDLTGNNLYCLCLGGRRSPAVACWASDHWVASLNPLGGKFRHRYPRRICLAQFSLNNVHKRGLKHHHFISIVSALVGWSVAHTYNYTFIPLCHINPLEF